MIKRLLLLPVATVLIACATESTYDPLEDYEAVGAATILDAPSPAGAGDSPESRRIVERGAYLVELLGCGSCHTDGALVGEPRADRALAGSRIGIAYTNPLQFRYPGIVFAPNITPDDETGIGRWTVEQIVAALREGEGRHGSRPILVMPWQGYTRMTYEDAYAMARYLQSLAPVRHQVPADVAPGRETREQFVHFGVYRSK